MSHHTIVLLSIVPDRRPRLWNPPHGSFMHQVSLQPHCLPEGIQFAACASISALSLPET